jgi:pilus assembly protein CpaB
MKLRPLLFGVIVALLGVVLQIVYMRRFEEEASGGAKVDLLVAAQPIERGKPVTAEMLGVRSIPQAYVDDRAIRAADRDKILNLQTTTKVSALQTLAWTDFVATTDDQRDLSSLVQPGNRAMPVKVQFEEALQLIRPGDFVDILSVDAEGRGASVLLQRVLVLAAGLDTTVESSDKKSPSWLRASLLTVSVSLQEAQLLGLAQTIGRLMAIVRNTADPRVMEAPPDVSRTELFDFTARQAVQSARRRPVRLEPGVAP